MGAPPQLAASSRVDLSDDGSERAKAVAEGAEEALLPQFLRDVVKGALDLSSDLADQLLAGTFDVPRAPGGQ